MVACPACSTANAFSWTSKRRFENSHQGLLLLQRCRNIKHLKQIHAYLLRKGVAHNPFLVTKLINLYSSYRRINIAALLFNQIQDPPTFTWNIMILSYNRNNSPIDAVLFYNLMLSRNVSPDKFTFPFVIKACLDSSSVQTGKIVHAHVLKTGFAGDMFVQNTLMDLYLKCGDLADGRSVFNKMVVRNVVSWTTMVSGLVVRGDLRAARALFEVMPVKNVVSWTAMVNGYARNGQPQEAFELFRRMQLENVRPNEFTLVSLLISCTELGSLSLGRWVHEFARKNKVEIGIFLGTALIDMYSKCGSVEDAIKVFDDMPNRSLATWNAMITSLGVDGRGKEAIALFSKMEKANAKPDEITFVGLLSACVNTCMVDEGFGFFLNMTRRYGIKPTLEHCVCMVELLGRAGMWREAHELVKNMKPDVDVWVALLRACRENGDIELEEVVYRRFLAIQCKQNIIALGGKWVDL